MSGPGRPPRLALVAGLALLLALALAARLAPAGAAFVRGAYVPVDSDALYHLRRMALSAEAWPGLSTRDPLMSWPGGGPIPWGPGFDLAGAAALRLGEATGLGGWMAVALLHLALALLLVLLTVELTLFLLPARPGRLAAGLAAGAVVALLPQAAASTTLGMVDHHVVEALILLALARWALAADPAGAGTVRRRVAFEALGAALAGGAVLAFTGSPLYVALVLPLLAWSALAAPRPRLLGSGAPGLLLGAALAAPATATFVAAHGRALAFGFPSWLQPALLVAAAAGVAQAVLAGRLAAGASPARRLAVLLGLGAAGLLAALLLVPALGAEGRAALTGWLLRRDPWLAQVDEFQPMWGGGPAEALRTTRRFLGAAGLLLPLALPLAPAAAGPGRRARGAAALLVGGAAFGLALLQNRFGRVAAPWIGVGLGLALAWLAARLGAAGGRRARLAAALPLLAVLALAALDPRMRATLRRPPPEPVDATVEVGLDLAGWPADPAAPGVLAPWDFGNFALVLGGRPVVANGFGSYPDAAAFADAERAFTVGEPELLAIARARRVGVVLGGASNLFGRVAGVGSAIPFTGAGLDGNWLRTTPSAPLLIGGSGVPSLGVRHAEHLLPRFASTRAVRGIERPLPVLWGYEIVAGARVEGRAGPGQRVVLEVPLEEHGRAHTWRAFADAGPDGRWAATVPVPTDLASPTVRTAAGRWAAAGGPGGPLDVPEAAVRAGAPVAAAAAAR